MIYVTDKKRHLICVPYSIENLHAMAIKLNIKRCWFHKHHYDIPKTRIDEIEKKCVIVSKESIVDIIKRPDLADHIIGNGRRGNSKSKGIGFEVTQMKYKGTIN